MIPFSELNAPTRLYISGEYLDAAGGGTFETLNPATGELLGPVSYTHLTLPTIYSV